MNNTREAGRMSFAVPDSLNAVLRDYRCSFLPEKLSDICPKNFPTNDGFCIFAKIESYVRYYTDPSIGIASLSIGPKDLENDLNTFGLFFETLAIRDLRTYADALIGEVAHYRDADKLECDAVVHLRDGRYGLVEVKLGGDALINEGVESLTTLNNKLDTTKMKKPSFLMVLTGVGSIAYKRPEDGIYVVPIGCLRP